MENAISSLEALGYPNHYVGLTWRSLDSGKNKNKDLQGILKKHDATHGVVLTGIDRDNQKVHSVGIAPKLTKRYYSAAALVATVLTQASKADPSAVTDAVFVQKLDENRYWYLLILDCIVASGTNDVVLDSLDAVQSRLYEDMRNWQLDRFDMRYYMPEELIERVSFDYPEIGKGRIELEYREILESGASNIKPFRITPLKKVTDRSGQLRGKRIGSYLLLAGAVGFLLYTQLGKQDKSNRPLIDDSLFTKTTRALSTEPKIDLEAQNLADVKQAQTQEAKWIGQRLAMSSPESTLEQLQKYIDTLPISVGGWFPKRVEYGLAATTDTDISSHLSAPDIIFSKMMRVTWQNGTGDVNSFRNNYKLDGRAIYQLNGEVVEVIKKEDVPIPPHSFSIEEAQKYLASTELTYLDLMTTLQGLEAKYSENFSWSISTNIAKKRLYPFKKTSGGTIDFPTMPYTKVQMTLNIGGFATGYQILKAMNNPLSNYPYMTITSVSVALETEEIVLVAEYLQKNVSVNEEGAN